jgi:hypothetical protein
LTATVYQNQNLATKRRCFFWENQIFEKLGAKDSFHSLLKYLHHLGLILANFLRIPVKSKKIYKNRPYDVAKVTSRTTKRHNDMD